MLVVAMVVLGGSGGRGAGEGGKREAGEGGGCVSFWDFIYDSLPYVLNTGI